MNVEFVEELDYDIEGLHPSTTYLVTVYNEVGSQEFAAGGHSQAWSVPITEFQETSMYMYRVSQKKVWCSRLSVF